MGGVVVEMWADDGVMEMGQGVTLVVDDESCTWLGEVSTVLGVPLIIGEVVVVVCAWSFAIGGQEAGV